MTFLGQTCIARRTQTFSRILESSGPKSDDLKCVLLLKYLSLWDPLKNTKKLL